MRLVRLLIDLALTHVFGRARQSIVAILGVALGVGFSVAISALMQGEDEDFLARLVDEMPNVQITDEWRTARRQPAEDVFGVAAIRGLHPRDDRRGILDPGLVVSRLTAWVPGKVAVGLRTQGVARWGGRDLGVSLVGIEPENETKVSSLPKHFRAGRLEALATGGDAIVVGDRLAAKLGAEMGTTIAVVSATGEQRNLKIVGLFHTGTTTRDEGEGYVTLSVAQVLSRRPNAVNEIRLRLDDPDRAPEVARRAEAQIGYKSVSWQEANESLLDVLVIRRVIMDTVVGAIMLVAGFGIFNIVSTITHEKARDIAILKALGFTGADMRRLFLLEGLILGAVGSLAGWAIGFTLSYALSQVTFELSGGAVAVEWDHLPIAWTFQPYLISAGFALAAAGVAGWLPARAAARLDPVAIVRGAT